MLLFSACAILAIIFNVRYLLKEKKRKAAPICALCVAVLILALGLGPLLNGGFSLLSEKEVEAIEITGTIEDMQPVNYFTIPIFRGESCDYGPTDKWYEASGVEFTINGVKCKCKRKGDLQIGDEVTVKYLSKSGYILSIFEIS